MRILILIELGDLTKRVMVIVKVFVVTIFVKMMSKDYVRELRRSFFMLPPNIDTQDKYDFSGINLKHVAFL